MTISPHTPRYWTTALSCFVCGLLGVGLFSCFSFFVEPVAAELGTTHSVINTAAVIIMIAPAVIGPVLGRLLDAVVARRIMLTGVALAMLSLVAVSISATVLAAGLAFIGYAIGQALYGPIVTNVVLIRKYREKSGRALSIASLGASIGPICLPLLIALLFTFLDWRSTLQLIALGVGLPLATSIWLGVGPRDGRMHADDQGHGQPPVATVLKRPEFWLIGLFIALLFNAAMLINITYAPHFTALGLKHSAVAQLIACGGAAGLLAKMVVGVYVDRWKHAIRLIAASVALSMASGFALLASSEHYALFILGAALIGGGGGASLPVYPFLNSAYFAPHLIGLVSGSQVPIFIPPSLIVAPLAGAVFDRVGSYALVYGTAVGVLLLVAIGLLLLPRPWQHETEQPNTSEGLVPASDA